jgi:hypothetical protein
MRALWQARTLPGLSSSSFKAEPASNPDLFSSNHSKPLEASHGRAASVDSDFDDLVLPFSNASKRKSAFRTPELSQQAMFDETEPSPASAVSSARLKRLSKVSRASSAKEDLLMDLLGSEAMLEARSFEVYNWQELEAVKRVRSRSALLSAMPELNRTGPSTRCEQIERSNS